MRVRIVTVVGTAFLMSCAAAAWGESKKPSFEEWFPRLRPGTWVKVQGRMDDKGALRAEQIKVLDGDLDESELESSIIAVDSLQRRLRTSYGTEILATAKTEVRGPKKTRASFGSLHAGDRIDAEGHLQKDGRLQADEITIKRPKQHDDGEKPRDGQEVKGRIESLDAKQHTLVLLGVTVRLDEQTKDKTPVLE